MRLVFVGYFSVSAVLSLEPVNTNEGFMSKRLLPILGFSLASLFTTITWAVPVSSFVPGGVCDPSRVTLTSIMESGQANELLGGANPSYSAGSCLVFDGNDDNAENKPNVNIGQKNDGLLNTTYGLGNSLFFIEPDELQNLDNNPVDVADDPGWIHLASVNENLDVDYNQVGPVVNSGLSLDIGALLSMSFTCVEGVTGECKSLTWQIETDPSIIDQVSQILGGATFDHLAFSVKASNGFILYDFDFIDIFAQELSDFPNSTLNFTTPYKLSGTLNTNDFLNPQGNNAQGISHLNVWARDPSDPEPRVLVTEPSTFGIIILAIFGVVITQYSRKY